MPNGGIDNCGECDFASGLGSDGARCEIRNTLIEHPFWTYCANHPKNNPLKVQIAVGPIYEDAGEFPYRRRVLRPSPPGHIEEKLRLLERLVQGDLDTSSRIFQVELVKDLGEARSEEAVPLLVALVVAEHGSLGLVADFDPNQDVFDLGDAHETRAARMEYLRLASLRALRRIWHERGSNRVLDELERQRKSANPEQLVWISFAIVFITAYEEPP